MAVGRPVGWIGLCELVDDIGRTGWQLTILQVFLQFLQNCGKLVPHDNRIPNSVVERRVSLLMQSEAMGPQPESLFFVDYVVLCPQIDDRGHSTGGIGQPLEGIKYARPEGVEFWCDV